MVGVEAHGTRSPKSGGAHTGLGLAVWVSDSL
jgi:hypothetical protein